jgi:hypothetical protein
MSAMHDFRYRCEDLQVELAKVHSDAKQIADLKVKVESAEAHGVDVAAASERHLKGFEFELICDLAELHTLYVRNAKVIGGLCSLMPKGEPSTADYLRWLSTDISSLPDMFGGVNENFATAAVEGAVDLEAMQDAAVSSSDKSCPLGEMCGGLHAQW